MTLAFQGSGADGLIATRGGSGRGSARIGSSDRDCWSCGAGLLHRGGAGEEANGKNEVERLRAPFLCACHRSPKVRYA